MKVAAIVVTYNRKVLLLECIEALKNARNELSSEVNCEMDIVVVDNASTDGTREALADAASGGEIVYLNTGANLGGAGGFNYGMKYAVSKGYDFVWAMDDDTIVREGALRAFVDFECENHGRYSFLSSLALWTDEKLNLMNIQKKSLTEKIEGLDENIQEEAVEIGMASFVSIWIPCEIIKKVGLPIKEFFIWADDIEYTRRLNRVKKGYLLPKSKVLHKTKLNAGSNIAEDSEERLERYRYSYRNEIYVYRHEGLKAKVYCALRLGLHSVRVIGKSDKKLKRLSIIWGSTLKGFGFKPEIEYVEE